MSATHPLLPDHPRKAPRLFAVRTRLRSVARVLGVGTAVAFFALTYIVVNVIGVGLRLVTRMARPFRD